MNTRLFLICGLMLGLTVACEQGPGASESASQTGDTKPAESPQAPPQPAEPKIPEAELHARLKAANPNYNGEGSFRYDNAGGLTEVFLTNTGVTDLSPLKGLEFKAIDVMNTQISDLEPLRAAPLQVLMIENTAVTDLSPVAGKPVMRLRLNNTKVDNLAPVRGMPLRELNLQNTPVTDISPLEAAPLEMAWFNNTPVEDISVLARMPLISLTLKGTKVKDLRPLKLCPSLQRLHIGDTEVTDLTPLADLNLTRLIFDPSKITQGLDAVRKMESLTQLGLRFDEQNKPMAPDAFWKLHDAGELK